MKERITKGWTVGRVLYLALGLFVVVQSIMQQQWLGVLLGGYFASMGLFSFGCAAGNCYSSPQQGQGSNRAAQSDVQSMQDIQFEEIKK